MQTTQIDLLLQPEVEQITRLSGTTLWRLERAGKFPRRLKIGVKRVAWSAQEVNSWLNTRMAEREPQGPTRRRNEAARRQDVTAT
jgi:prophage regulatory protein